MMQPPPRPAHVRLPSQSQVTPSRSTARQVQRGGPRASSPSCTRLAALRHCVQLLATAGGESWEQRARMCAEEVRLRQETRKRPRPLAGTRAAPGTTAKTEATSKTTSRRRNAAKHAGRPRRGSGMKMSSAAAMVSIPPIALPPPQQAWATASPISPPPPTSLAPCLLPRLHPRRLALLAPVTVPLAAPAARGALADPMSRREQSIHRRATRPALSTPYSSAGVMGGRVRETSHPHGLTASDFLRMRLRATMGALQQSYSAPAPQSTAARTATSLARAAAEAEEASKARTPWTTTQPVSAGIAARRRS